MPGRYEPGQLTRWKRKERAATTAAEDKAARNATEVTGKIKEAAGRATDDEELETQGQADQGEGNLKQAGDKAKDASKKVRQISLRPPRKDHAGRADRIS